MNQHSTPQTPTSTNNRDDEIDLIALFYTLLERKKSIIAITAAFAVSGVLYTLLATPIYRATAIVQVEEDSPGLAGLSDVTEAFGMSSGAAVTEIELIKSRSIIGAAVDAEHLDIVVEPNYFPVIGKAFARFYSGAPGTLANPFFGVNQFASGGEAIVVTEFSPPISMIKEDYTLVAGENGAFDLLDPKNNLVLEGRIGETINSENHSIFVQQLIARPGTQFTITKHRRLNTIIDYRERLGASERGKDSGIISLSIEDEDPIKAERILNTIATHYLRQNVERNSAEAAKSVEFLKKQLPKIKQDLEAAEKKFNDYQVKVGSVNITAETEVLLDQVVEIESAIAELHLQKSELDRKYTTDHPAFQAWREQLAEQESRKNQLTSRIGDLPETQQELLGLKRDLEVGTEIYTQMLNNIQELDIIRAGTVGNVRIIDDAAADIEEPVKPKKALIAVVFTLLGGFLSVALALVRSALNRGVSSADEIEALGLPVYASIPLSPEQNKHDEKEAVKRFGMRFVRKSAHPNMLLAERYPTDVSVEALRSLRTSLHFAMLEANNNIIMISGPSPGVGKSFVSGNLAAVVAQADKKVLLIDLDMRKGFIHKMFNVNNEIGASAVLSRQATLSEAIVATNISNLDFLPRGSVPPNPSELLMSEGMAALLKETCQSYDSVIVDTPPILAVTDPAIVGRHCGVTMIVTRFELNPAKEIALTKQRFEQNGITVKGAILNAIERKASNYGYSYYQYDYKSVDG